MHITRKLCICTCRFSAQCKLLTRLVIATLPVSLLTAPMGPSHPTALTPCFPLFLGPGSHGFLFVLIPKEIRRVMVEKNLALGVFKSS